jgi:hypothetical protein
MTHSGNDTADILAAVEPASALAIGGVLGATTFFLFALLLGPRAAMAVAGIATVIAVLRRVPVAAIVFAAATALAAVALLSSTGALVGAAAAFGVALAILARSRMRSRIVDAMSGMHESSGSEGVTGA